jgi:hypothetical protein
MKANLKEVLGAGAYTHRSRERSAEKESRNLGFFVPLFQ